VRSMVGTRPFGLVMLVALVWTTALTGCSVTGRGPALHAAANPTVASDAPATDDVGTGLPMFMEKALKTDPDGDPEHESAQVQGHDYDPWEAFNERMFNFNYAVDRKVVKPAAAGWGKVVPEPYRKGLQNAVRNVGMPRRFVNNLLQLKIDGAFRELTGFVLNSTVGLGGIGDVARAEGITPPDEEDTGQTLAVYGVKPGPYLVLPLFPPSTVRDTIGSTIDGLLDPVSLVMPFVGSVAKRVGTTVNDRSLNLQLYEEVEASVLDLYSGVRNLHLQRRERAINE
jgi:phospholipid-binding lipoprotein MlaA